MWTSCGHSRTGICETGKGCNHGNVCNLEISNPVSQRFSPAETPLVMPSAFGPADYSGQGDAGVGAEETPLEMPKMNFSPKANFAKLVKSEDEEVGTESPLVMPVMNFGKKKKSDEVDDDEEVEEEEEEVEDEEEEEETETGQFALRTALQSALQEKDNDAFIEEIFEDFFVYTKSGKVYKQNYTVDEEGVVDISGLPEQVYRSVQYKKLEV